MRRARSRAERRAREERARGRRRLLSAGLIIGLTLAALALPAALVWRQVSQARLGLDERGCAERERPRHVVVLIDQTDPLDPRWAAFAQKLAPALTAAASFPTYGRISIYTLTPDAALPIKRVLAECKPPDPRSGSVLFDTRAEREAREARFSGFYEERIAAAARELGARRSPREASPLLEALVALQAELAAWPAERAELIVVSDMMQYSDAFSQYGRYEPFAEFHATRKGQALTPFLEVERARLYYVRRSELAERQDAAHLDFWRALFLAAGVKTLDVVEDPLAAIAPLQ